MGSLDTCIPMFGSQFCREDNEGAPSNWRLRRNRGWCLRWRSCTSKIQEQRTEKTSPTLYRLFPPIAEACPASCTVPTATDQTPRSVSASRRRGPLRLWNENGLELLLPHTKHTLSKDSKLFSQTLPSSQSKFFTFVSALILFFFLTFINLITCTVAFYLSQFKNKIVLFCLHFFLSKLSVTHFFF